MLLLSATARAVSPSPPPAYPPYPPTGCANATDPSCMVHLSMSPCSYYRINTNQTVAALTGQECLRIDSGFYLAFVAGWCYQNVGQGQVAAVNCFDISSGQYYGKFVDYYASEGGIVLSADLKSDFAGLGYNNAPASGQGTDGSMPPTVHTPLDSLLADCASLSSASLCPFSDIADACPCACGLPACTGSDDALPTVTKDAAITYYSQTHLVIPIKQGYQFVLSTNPNVTQIWAVSRHGLMWSRHESRRNLAVV